MTKTWKHFALRAVPGKMMNSTLNLAHDTGRLLGLAILIFSVGSMGGAKASGTPKPKPQPKPKMVERRNTPLKVSPLLLKQREDWRKSMVRSPRPKKGCFVASYPQTAWKEVPCVTPELIPFGPHR